MTSSMEADLCKTPAAPAATARARESRSRFAVRTRATACGFFARSSPMRPVPSPSGIGEAEIHDRHIHAAGKLFEPLVRLGERTRLRDDLDTRLKLEGSGEKLAEYRVILDEKHAHHRAASPERDPIRLPV